MHHIILNIMKVSYLFLARGFEEVEALTAVDILRRAGMTVKTVSITDALQVEGAHGISVTADCLFADAKFSDADWLILPGGMPGSVNLHEFVPLQNLLREHANANRGIAAICAAPSLVLCPLGLLHGRKATCYPGMENKDGGAIWTGEPVVADKRFVLGNGPANAMLWALNIVEQAESTTRAREVAAGLIFFPAQDSDLDFTFG